MTAATIFCPTLQEAFERAGMRWPDKDMAPGSLVRFSTDDKKPGDLAGWCKVFSDSNGASFGDNREGSKHTWQQRDTGSPKPTRAEIQDARIRAQQARQQADSDLGRQHQTAAATAARIWAETRDVDPESAYIKRKAIIPYGARQDLDGSIVVPVFGPDAKIQSLQFIGIDGAKRFLPRARMKGGRLVIGEIENGQQIIFAEGWATGCSIHEATGQAVVVGFSGSNLAAVAADLRRKFPDSPIVLAGDLDEHGQGMKYAQAAAGTGAPSIVVLPKFADGRASGDWNDMHLDEGPGEVRRQLEPQQAAPSAVVPFEAPVLLGTDARDGTRTTRPLTELGNAQRLLDGSGENIKYIPEVAGWLVWKVSAWQWDVDGAKVRALAALLPRTIYAEGVAYPLEGEHFARWARRSAERKTLSAGPALLSDFEAVRLPMAHIDDGEFLVGIDGARQVIDLNTGSVRPARRDDYVTKSLGVGFLGKAARATRWLQFLVEVFEGNQALIDWLQKFLGYTLTASTREHIFLFLHGHGKNGKSVLLEVLKHVGGDYCRAISSETLTETKRVGGAASPDLAALVGARLAMSSETEDGCALAESLVKGLVSGDSMSARKLYSAPFEFKPAVKLLMAGNHKPIVRGNDHGIWRRVRLLPFSRTFTEADDDKGLLDKLRAEAPHILAWMVEGCVRWQREGLDDTPAVVKAATDAYRVDQDIVGAWLAECTEISRMGEVSAGDMYANYKTWSLDNGHKPSSNVVLGRRLSERGFTVRQSHGKRIWCGLALTDAKQAENYARGRDGF